MWLSEYCLVIGRVFSLDVFVCVFWRYNNQWMIVDYNHFAPGKTDIEEGLFVVLEQIP